MSFEPISPNPLRQQRIEKMEAEGIVPYAAKFSKTSNIIDVRQDFSYVDYDGQDIEFSLCGRVTGVRLLDDQLLIELEEGLVRLQFVVEEAVIGASGFTSIQKFVLTGDWVGFTIDRVFRLPNRELAARVRHWAMLAPSLVDMPVDSLYDTHRYRHLELAVDVTVRRRFIARSRIVRYIRAFLEEQFDFLETPVSLSHDLMTPYQHAFWLNRLISGGIEAVYEIAPISGAESLYWCGYPHSHRLSCLRSMTDTTEMMRLIRRFIRELATEFVGYRQLSRSAGRSAWQEFLSRNSDDTAQEEVIDLNNQWRSVRFYDLIFQMTGIDFYPMESLAAAQDAARQTLGFSAEKPVTSVGAFLIQIAQTLIFPTLIQPTFVVDFPPEAQPFARRNGNSRTISYFELFMDGARIAAGNDEINDPRQLEESFSDQHVNVAHRSPEQKESLCHALTCGQPPSASLQISIERLIMLLCRVDDVRKIVYFPIEEMRDSS